MEGRRRVCGPKVRNKSRIMPGDTKRPDILLCTRELFPPFTILPLSNPALQAAQGNACGHPAEEDSHQRCGQRADQAWQRPGEAEGKDGKLIHCLSRLDPLCSPRSFPSED